jgi:hypothetical protein
VCLLGLEYHKIPVSTPDPYTLPFSLSLCLALGVCVFLSLFAVRFS